MTVPALVDDLLNPDVDQEVVALDGDAFAHIERLANAGAVTATAFMLEKKIPWARYEAICAYMGSMNRSCSWWIGDLLLYGEMVFGERYAQAALVTGLAPQTLMNRVWVCKSIPPERRVAGVPFSVHALVASRPAAEQRRWLRLAHKHGWTRAELTHELREHDRAQSEPDEASSTGAEERATPEESTVDVERSIEEPTEPGALRDYVHEMVKTAEPLGDDYYRIHGVVLRGLEELV